MKSRNVAGWAAANTIVLVAALFVVQAPRSLVVYGGIDRDGQLAALRRVGAVDERCRRHGIAADTARRALPPLPIPGEPEAFDAWELLRGSDEPREMTVEEARRLLEGGEP